MKKETIEAVKAAEKKDNEGRTTIRGIQEEVYDRVGIGEHLDN